MKFVEELCSLKCYRGESHWICPHYRSQRGSVCKLRATGAPDCQWCVAVEFTLGELQLCFVENLMWTTVDTNAVKNYVWNARWNANVYNVGSSSSQLCRCLQVCKPYPRDHITNNFSLLTNRPIDSYSLETLFRSVGLFMFANTEACCCCRSVLVACWQVSVLASLWSCWRRSSAIGQFVCIWKTSQVCWHSQLGAAANFDDLVKFGERRQIRRSQMFIKLAFEFGSDVIFMSHPITQSLGSKLR